MWRSKTVPDSDAGFTLAEVLAASGVTALAFVLLFDLFGATVRDASAARNLGIAATLGRTVLDGAGALYPVAPGRYQGTFALEGFAWRVKIRETARSEGPDGVRLYEIAVTILWTETGGTQAARFVTARLIEEGGDQ